MGFRRGNFVELSGFGVFPGLGGEWVELLAACFGVVVFPSNHSLLVPIQDQDQDQD